MKKHTSSGFYTKEEERLNTLSHGVGILIGILGGGYLLYLAIDSNNPWAVAGMLIYLFGMLSSYVSSTLYHAAPPSPRKDLLRKFDHAAIYLHIAGSYSPIMLVTLREVGFWGWSILIFVWLCAVVGVVVSFHKLKAHSHLKTICYVAMACSILIAFKPLLEVVSVQFLYWLLAEAFFYITGAVLYSFYKLPYMHSVFHLFVLGGTICHMMVLWYVL
ncbi:hemolysin III [Parabacteroides sp. PF5-5]|uniref:PAQR family membrane homeostasis protein TrhA n=1 Tax=unclassified Parabacteroides TaxID=2649774 RepID=UPI002472F235|nr:MULTISPECIES: hemolysin III family protein [unclassified Parabacteroides]MDH6305168.1 hemolysin III [Parabacteroides sp. PH5-39]MDH6316518.1 hemolysin III [Parabacteroides sp. PF5-13]MDH6320028.1 hemolysin III [Parabacteroides sp. PH5-13]MDH6323739.1 hemolysin III [Parabacteroides sp. PH5-8]MDH6327705.1 hemolysin III [Parabacteroides sp. PH5-41]